jgi:tartrate dehydratase alpha subunit/fumarate hydratase class I-like protein
LGDPEASDNDKFVAMQLLKNANIAAAKVLPSCQVNQPVRVFAMIMTTARTPELPL